MTSDPEEDALTHAAAAIDPPATNRPKLTLVPSTSQPEFLERARTILTTAEYEVIRLRIAGMREKQIALALGITQRAVHTRIARARRKLKRKDRA